MVQIKVVDLSELGVHLPEDSVRMTVAQPYIGDGMLTQNEPYRVADEVIERQLETVTTTVDIATTRKADFTIIPEYGVPGLDGIAAIEERLKSEAWRPGAILIGGIDGLSKGQYAAVVEADRTYVDSSNGKESVEDDQWVNCCITWVKSSDGSLLRWVQPKLWPAGPEMSAKHHRMFKGRSIYLFRGRRTSGEPYTFATMICFDWIAPTNPNPAERLLEQAHCAAGESQIPITWVFVIQHNEKPSHFEFLNRIVNFFRDPSHPNATTNNTCLIFANTAGKSGPGNCSTHGTSGIVLSPHAAIRTQGGLPTFAHDGRSWRRDNAQVLFEARCRDVVLRESGECIHAFDQINPSRIQPGAAGRRYAVENASVHTARGGSHILAPGTGVAAAVKWVNDQLDNFCTPMPAHAEILGKELESIRNCVVKELRSGDSKDLDLVVRRATPLSEKNPDEWSEQEGHGLCHVVCSLQIVALGAKLVSVGVEKVHGVVSWKGQCFDVMAVRGQTHRQCVEHMRNAHGKRQRRHLLLISRDAENLPKDRRNDNILRPRKQALGKRCAHTTLSLV